jgi:transposase
MVVFFYGEMCMEQIGKPLKLHDAITHVVLEAKRSGNSYRNAAKAAGIGRNTLLRWLRKGEAGTEPYTLFASAYHDAEKQFWDDKLAQVRQNSAPS